MEVITWIISGIALIGTILNAEQKRFGFVLWLITNACWVVIDYRAGLYAQSALFFVYFLLAIRGMKVWKGKGNGKKENI